MNENDWEDQIGAEGDVFDNEAGEEAAEALEEAVDEAGALRAENAELKNRLLSSMAEMENLRKRTAREKTDASRYAIAKFARDLLTVGDDLRRAIDAVPAEAREKTDDPVATLLSGVEVTERQLLQILDRHGVQRFEPMGEKFNPAIHEALFEQPDPSKPNGTVVQVIEAGFMIGGRVLRPARVGIAKGGPKVAAQAEAAPAAESAPPEPTGETTSAPGGDTVQEPQVGQEQAAGDAGPQGATESDGREVGGRIDRTA